MGRTDNLHQGGVIMKNLVIFLAAFLILCGSNAARADDGFFDLSPDKIEEAIQYGKTADYKINEFGGYDLGLNKFSLGDKIGYIDLLTPFVRIAGLSLKMKGSGEQLSFEEAQERGKKPVELRAFLYVTKADLEDPMQCLITTSKDELDISDMVMEFSMCDDKTGDCVRSLAYLFPVIDLQKEHVFHIILRGERLGEKRVEIKTSQIK
jgi:hypothetical protein